MNIHDKETAADAIREAGDTFVDEYENAEQYLSDIDQPRDFDYTSNLDELDEDALEELRSQVPSSSDLRALQDTVADMMRAAEKFEAAIEEAEEYLDTEYEVVVVFTLKASSEDEAQDKVEKAIQSFGNAEVDEVREA